MFLLVNSTLAFLQWFNWLIIIVLLVSSLWGHGATTSSIMTFSLTTLSTTKQKRRTQQNETRCWVSFMLSVKFLLLGWMSLYWMSWHYWYVVPVSWVCSLKVEVIKLTFCCLKMINLCKGYKGNWIMGKGRSIVIVK